MGVVFLVARGQYPEGGGSPYSPSSRDSAHGLRSIDAFDAGRKSVPGEALDKVRELWHRRKGYKDTAYR